MQSHMPLGILKRLWYSLCYYNTHLNQIEQKRRLNEILCSLDRLQHINQGNMMA